MTLWSAAAWPYVVMAICFLTSAFVYRAHHDPSEGIDPLIQWHSMDVFEKLGVVLAYLASISLPHGLAAAGATIVVWSDLQGKEVDLRSVFSRIRQSLLRLVVLSLCISSMCTIAGLIFVVPGVLVFPVMSFAIAVLEIEGAKVSTALRRGIKLASSRLGALLGLYAAVLFVVVVVAVCAIYIASTVDFAWWVGITTFWVSFVALAPILMMGTTAVVVHLYQDICEQQTELATGKTQAGNCGTTA